MRPANVVTAWADVFAGAAAAGVLAGTTGGGAAAMGGLPALVAATTGLYAGGVVLNDVFDAALDAVERPERPIPSGRISRPAAAGLGAALLAAGLAAAAAAGPTSFVLAGAIAAAAVGYDAWAKHRPVLGPLAMGACRGGNLLLGASLVPAALAAVAPLALLPVAYVAAITLIARGEVRGGDPVAVRGAAALVALVLLAIAGLGALGWDGYRTLPAFAGVGLLGAWVGPPLLRAARRADAPSARRAVGAAVVALIPLNAALAAGTAGWLAGAAVLALWPLSLALKQRFAVT
jgi:4-hydroxybenzoate polyprenyltransferase